MKLMVTKCTKCGNRVTILGNFETLCGEPCSCDDDIPVNITCSLEMPNEEFMDYLEKYERYMEIDKKQQESLSKRVE